MRDKNKLSCSEATKLNIAEALKTLMKTRSFDKISVSDITSQCCIHRQTFYYHFADKNELLDYIIRIELIEPLLSDFTLDNMYEKFFFLFDTIKSNQQFYQSALKTNAGDLFGFISRLTTERFIDIFKEIEISNHFTLKNDFDNKIIAEFFGFGIAGVVFEWAQQGMLDSPEMLTKRIEGIISDCKRLAASRF